VKSNLALAPYAGTSFGIYQLKSGKVALWKFLRIKEAFRPEFLE
jgi:hypothetical protein